MSDAERVLEASGLRVWYAMPGRAERRLVAVDGIDLVVHAGECLGLVGESGSGKSSLARAVLGLLPEGAGEEGELRVAGSQTIGMSEEAREQKAQDPARPVDAGGGPVR